MQSPAIRTLDSSELASTCGGSKLYKLPEGAALPKGSTFFLHKKEFIVLKHGKIKPMMHFNDLVR